MARIRSIKPEFPQSESMGNVSRDARLTFIQLWTLADDEGRLRGNSRMLASLLFPYDDDAPALIDGWLKELEEEGCIARYKVEGQSYVQVRNWLIHQKIDKPSKSKIPALDESSRILANPRLRIKDQGEDQGSKEGNNNTGAAAPVEVVASPDDPADLDNPMAAPLPMREQPPISEDPVVVLSVALRRQGVSATAMHPTVIAWAERGVPLEVLTEAVRLAREHKGDEKIPPNYLVPIVDKLLNPPAGRQASPGAVNEKFNFAHLDRSGDQRAMAESMQRHGITVPGEDEEIEI